MRLDRSALGYRSIEENRHDNGVNNELYIGGKLYIELQRMLADNGRNVASIMYDEHYSKCKGAHHTRTIMTYTNCDRRGREIDSIFEEGVFVRFDK